MPGIGPGRLGADTAATIASTEESVLQARAQATKVRPDTRPADRRRLAAAGLSAVIPGLGQLFNRRPRLAALFLVPSLVVIVLALMLVQTQSPARLAAWVVSPQVLGTLLILNWLVLAWRLLAVGQAFLDTGRTGPTGRLGVIGIVVIALLVVRPARRHLALRHDHGRHLRPDLPVGVGRGRRRRRGRARSRRMASGSTSCWSASTSCPTAARR